MTDEQLAFVTRWATQYGALAQLAGEVGFGRECVGVLVGNCYIDYDYDDGIWTPGDAYHKCTCLAVLGRGEVAEQQLYEWVRWLADNDWGIETSERRPENALDLMMNGTTSSRLVRIETS